MKSNTDASDRGGELERSPEPSGRDSSTRLGSAHSSSETGRDKQASKRASDFTFEMVFAVNHQSDVANLAARLFCH